MTSPFALLAVSLPPQMTSHVYCASCDHALDPWEVHLLKRPACPSCGRELELALGVVVDLD